MNPTDPASATSARTEAVNETPTPETDADLWCHSSGGMIAKGFPLTVENCPWTKADTARKLECERDELRNIAEKQHVREQEQLAELAELRQQRDDAITELNQYRDSMAWLTELHATPGKMDATIRQRPDLAALISRCFAEMVRESENYTEAKFVLHHPTEDAEWITVLVQKSKGKTPHQLRQQTEQELAAVRYNLEKSEASNATFQRLCREAQDAAAEAQRERDELTREHSEAEAGLSELEPLVAALKHRHTATLAALRLCRDALNQIAVLDVKSGPDNEYFCPHCGKRGGTCCCNLRTDTPHSFKR